MPGLMDYLAQAGRAFGVSPEPIQHRSVREALASLRRDPAAVPSVWGEDPWGLEPGRDLVHEELQQATWPARHVEDRRQPAPLEEPRPWGWPYEHIGRYMEEGGGAPSGQYEPTGSPLVLRERLPNGTVRYVHAASFQEIDPRFVDEAYGLNTSADPFWREGRRDW